MANILIIDDEESIAWALRRAFERAGHVVAVSSSAEDGFKKLAAFPPAMVFLDVRLPGIDGLSALGTMQSLAPTARFVIMTAHGNLSTAVKAVEAGSFDYLAKPFDLAQALDTVQRALASQEVPAETTTPAAVSEEIIGHCAAMQNVFKRIAMVAGTDACVLITGESGTGKELVARAVHANSPRKDKPFLPVHVAAMNPNLVESELFGHVKGAFTGAERSRTGLLQLADGSTIFLDELADIPLAVQAKLLRVLERQEILPVGGTQTVPVNVRIVSATHADLPLAVRESRFRHDLFYRLNVYPIHLPPLRERGADIAVLSQHFVESILRQPATIPADTLKELQDRVWPGNVRELRNAIEHATIVGRGGPIRPEHLPVATNESLPFAFEQIVTEEIRKWVAARIALAGKDEPSELYQLLSDIVEKSLTAEVLERVNGNRLAAGRWLGLARATVRKIIRKHDLMPNAEPDEGE